MEAQHVPTSTGQLAAWSALSNSPSSSNFQPPTALLALNYVYDLYKYNFNMSLSHSTFGADGYPTPF